jgi:outer membrane receptor protein involved in Fe transport
MISNKLSKAVRLAIAFGAGTTASMSVNVSAEDKSENAVERIEVTGSKIKRIGDLSPTPVTVISGDALVNAGITNVADLLSEMPSSTVGLSPETTNNSVFSNGLSNTDLRGLGSSRTLVLVNGRRFISGAPGSSSVDLNNIPTSMIKRMEISTGGASAVYGSDAMAGVVNIITKKSMDGFEFDASTSQPQQDGGENSFASFTFGNEGEKASFITNISYTDSKQLRGDQRDFIRNGVIAIDHPDNVDNEDGIPRRIIFDETGSTTLRYYSPTGDFFTADGHYIFANDGSIRPFEEGTRLPASTTPGSRNTNYFTGEGDGYNFLKHKYVRTPLERLNLSTNINYDFSEEHSMAFELTYSNTHAYGESSPAFFGLGGMNADNAFFSQDTKDFFTEREMSSYTAYLTTDALGNRIYDQKRQLIQGALSFTGSINDNWMYDAYIQRGTVQSDTTWYGEMLVENFHNALDAVEVDGEIVCADRNEAGEVVGALSGCAPLNIWGEGLASQEALDYVKTDATRRASINQTTIGGTVTGDIFDLPAGPVATAFSFEHRKESSDTLPDPAMRNGLIFNNQSDALKGSFDVSEIAAEFSIPVVVDTAFAD